MKTLIAYKGDKKLRTALIKEIKKHEKADAITQGTYGEQNGQWKGCAVACSLRSLAIVNGEPLVTRYSAHARYETDLGISQIIARLEDGIFEGLAPQEAKKFPFKFASAIKEGANLKLVWPKFAVWLLIDKKDGVLQYAKSENSKKVILRVAELYQRIIDGKTVTNATWKAAADTADAAAYAAADAAAADTAYAAAADAAAAYAAAYAAADGAAAYAADAAAAYAAAYAAYAAAAYAADARRIYYTECANKLIKLLKEAK
jgi:hypothetical protein